MKTTEAQQSHRAMLGNDCEESNVWRKTGRDGYDWMSDGSELQRRDAATGNDGRDFPLHSNIQM